MAATIPAPAQRPVVHCTGRFDYALPPALRSSGSTQSIYLLDVSHELLVPGTGPAEAWKHRLAATLSGSAASAARTASTREFDLRGVGPAAWLRLTPAHPDDVTLLAMKPVADSGVALFLKAEASAGREAIAERVVTRIAASYAADSPAGFCMGTGAFVIEPSMNEHAIESFTAPGVRVSVETETVAEPDDGQSTDGDPPPGGRRLLKQGRRVGGFEGIEERVQLAEPDNASRLVYTWTFAGRAGDGAAPRIRLSAAGMSTQAATLDAAWNGLLESWRARPLGLR